MHAGRFTIYTRREGLPDDLVNAILEDEVGNLWISHDRGIYRVRKSELEAIAQGQAQMLHPVAYDEEDGLLSAETNGQKSHPSALKTRDGRLWFATAKGVAIFNPKKLPDDPHPPAVVIEEIRADGRPIFANLEAQATPATSGSDESAAPLLARTLTQRLDLAPGTARVLEVQFTANSFSSPEKVRFKYRLDGLDKDWVAAGARRTAYYANLRPGDYRFQVIAANKHGAFNQTGASFGFHLNPRFYQRKTFYVGCILSVSLLLWAFHRWRMGYLRRIHLLERQNALAKERERVARDVHDDLGPHMTQLAGLADMVLRLLPPSAAEAPGRRLSEGIRKAAATLREIIWATNPEADTTDDLVTRISQNAEDKARLAGLVFRFHFHSDVPSFPLPASVRRNCFLAAKEAVNNVIKHAQATELHVSVSFQSGLMVLTVRDNGRGFCPDKPPAERAGHGLRNMPVRMQEIGAKCEITSAPGQGTQVHLIVPIPDH
ncbi:MAG: ATP-binding protein [Chloroflexi bacterium]|nr:ATP-binding protein [Chloroflexota bacterium]